MSDANQTNPKRARRLFFAFAAVAIVIVLVLVLLAARREPGRSGNGREDAERDLSKGTLKFIFTGGPPGTREVPHYNRLLKERYGVTYELIAPGCSPPLDVSFEYMRAYNKRVLEELNARFGKETIEAVRNEGSVLDHKDSKEKGTVFRYVSD
jgi:hypothetical protein